MKAPRSSPSIKTLQRTEQQTEIAPPKRRRQLTATAPKFANPFDRLQNMANQALRGK